MDALIQILTDWGYVGMFFASILAGSVFPFCSEVVMAALFALGLSPTLLVCIASVGNTIGGMTCYYMGRLGHLDWIEKYCHIRHEKVLKLQKTLQGKGSLMAFFSFIPGIGAVIVVTLGFMRSNLMLTLISMFVGKVVRYIILVLALAGTLTLLG